jgi:hypothetical protein
MSYGDIMGKDGTAKQEVIPEAVDADGTQLRTSVIPQGSTSLGSRPIGTTTVSGVQRFAKSAGSFRGGLR